MAFALALRTYPDHCRLALAGELDTANAPALSAFIATEFDGCGRDLVVDLRQLTFLDAAGIGVLVEASRHLQAQAHDLTVLCASTRHLRLFILTGTAEQLGVRIPTSA